MFGSDDRARAARQEQEAQEAETRRQQEAAFPGFPPSATVPAFTYLYFHVGRAREIRLFEKHLTYHEQRAGAEIIHVIPYRSVNYFQYTNDGDDGPWILIYAADLTPSVKAPEAEIREIMERLATLIG